MFFNFKQSMFTIISIVFVGTGVGLAIFWKNMYHSLVVKKTVLSTETETFPIWQNPQFDIMFDIYLFNWTNPSDLSNGKSYEKPILKQIGPYRFRERHLKTQMQWHDHNFTVSYKRKGTYYFDEKGSKGRLNDRIISINTFGATIAQTAKGMNVAEKLAINVLLAGFNPKAYIDQTASELLFEGYRDSLIDLVRFGSDKLKLKIQMPFDRFGYMYPRNGSDDYLGHFNVATGKDDISKLGVTKKWNYRKASKLFEAPCNVIQGSSGELFPPFQTKDKPVTMFNGDLCRHVKLYFEKEVQINGITAYKYVSTERSLDNGTIDDDNSCFSNEKQFPSGVSDISGCRWGVPLVASLPHFYAADPYLLTQVGGLKPNKEDHEIFTAIEPESGSPINLVGRLQINTVIEPGMGIKPFRNSPRIFFPVLWIEQNLYIPDDITWKLNITAWIPTIGYVVFGALILIGVLLLTGTFLCKSCKSNRKRDIKSEIPQPDPHMTDIQSVRSNERTYERI